MGFMLHNVQTLILLYQGIVITNGFYLHLYPFRINMTNNKQCSMQRTICISTVYKRHKHLVILKFCIEVYQHVVLLNHHKRRKEQKIKLCWSKIHFYYCTCFNFQHYIFKYVYCRLYNLESHQKVKQQNFLTLLHTHAHGAIPI